MTAEFQADIPADAARSFARLSGDWNPLHTDPGYAAGTRFRRPILHGAFLAGLVSRMAGMHLPGTECLLHSLRLRFVAPIQPPVTVLVRGRIEADDGVFGRTQVSIEDVVRGTLYADAHYEFSRHQRSEGDKAAPAVDLGIGEAGPVKGPPPILVTGSSGALGRAVIGALGGRGLGLIREDSQEGFIGASEPDRPDSTRLPTTIGGIVHCGWPRPDNQRLLDIARARDVVEYNVAAPLRQILALARLLAERGTPEAILVLVGSTFAEPGRHNFRMPMYTLAKSLVPVVTRILALELAATGRRCVSVTFDVLDGGMNEGLGPRARIMNADRSPFGRIPTPDEAAAQIAWILENPGFLASGATLSLTGGAIP